jgi:hypothetical protein
MYHQQTNALFHKLCLQSLIWLLHVSALFSRHLQAADTIIPLNHTATQQVTTAHLYICCGINSD